MLSEECAVILAGGQGSRLRPYTTVLPKPLIPVGEVPILEIVIRQLRRHGIRRLILAVGYRDELLRSYFGDGKAFGVDLIYHKDECPLGTVGPLHLMAEELPESFLVMNSDVLTDLDFGACLESHRESGRMLTLARYQRRVQIQDGTLELGPDGRITGFQEKPCLKVWISIGISAMNRSVLELIPKGQPFGMDNLVLAMLDEKVAVNSYRHDGAWYDIGCTADLEQANKAFAAQPSLFLPAPKELLDVS